MDINSNLATFINLPAQYIAILLMNFYWLDTKPTPRKALKIFFWILLPTTVLFVFLNAVATFYLIGSLVFFFQREQADKIYILHILMSFTLAVIVDHLATLLSVPLFSGIGSEIAFILLRAAVFLLGLAFFAYVYKRFIKYLLEKYLVNRLVPYLLMFLIFLTLIFVYINIASMTDRSSYEGIKANFWVFVLYMICLAVIGASIIYVTLKQYRIRQREKEHENFLVYVRSLEEVNADMRKFKHDYTNILSSLRFYIDSGDQDGLRDYFYTHILKTGQQLKDEQGLSALNNLKVGALKGLLTTKLLHAEAHGIPVQLEVVEEIGAINMDIIQMNQAVGILLDNAIDASKTLIDPAVNLAFIRLEKSVLIVVMNKIDPAQEINIQEIQQEGYSTKGKDRGLGLSNLRKIVNQNQNLLLTTKVQKPYFIQELEIREGDST